MVRVRPLLLVSVCCLFLSEALSAQMAGRPAGAGAYFQMLIREAKTHIREIRADQLAGLRGANPSTVLVDVREDNEWNRSRIPGAIHVGRGVLEGAIESRISLKSTPIIVYCQGGGRSAVAADVLGKMGYTNVVSLAGGLGGYQAAGLPVDQSSPPR
jgi:rhodanese-related sulfurtransferase